MPRKKKDLKEIQVYGLEIKTTYLRSVIALKIMHNMTKNEIVDWLMEEYSYPFKNAVSAWRQGMTYLYLYGEETKQEIQLLSHARLELLFEQAAKDENLIAKDYYNIQMKNIDLVNKTCGVYDKDENTEQSTDISFNLNIGVENTDYTNDEKND